MKVELSTHELWRLINALQHDTTWREESKHAEQYQNEIDANHRLLTKFREAANPTETRII